MPPRSKKFYTSDLVSIEAAAKTGSGSVNVDELYRKYGGEINRVYNEIEAKLTSLRRSGELTREEYVKLHAKLGEWFRSAWESLSRWYVDAKRAVSEGREPPPWSMPKPPEILTAVGKKVEGQPKTKKVSGGGAASTQSTTSAASGLPGSTPRYQLHGGMRWREPLPERPVPGYAPSPPALLLEPPPALRSEVERVYREKLEQLERMRRDYIARVDARYREYRQREQRGEKLIIKVDINDDGEYELEFHSADEYRRWALRRIEEWYQKEKRRLEEWRRKALQKVEENTRRYNEWLQEMIQRAKHVTSQEDVARLAENVYQEALRFWRDAGLPEEEAERIARQAREKVERVAYAALEKWQEFTRRLEELYNRYHSMLAAAGVAAAAPASGLARLALAATAGIAAEKLANRFLEEARHLAGELGVPRELAEKQIQPLYQQLRKLVSKAAEAASKSIQLRRLYDKYARALQGMAEQLTANPAEALREMERLIDEFEREARKLGASDEWIRTAVSNLREWVAKVQAAADRWRAARQAAEEALQSFLRDARRNIAYHYENLDVLSERLRRRVMERIGSRVSKEQAEKLANWVVSRYRSEVQRLFREAYNRLGGGVYICLDQGATLLCKVYSKNGVLVSTSTFDKQAFQNGEPKALAHILNIGLRPEKVYIAKTREEWERAELAFLREANPQEYMRRVGQKAFSIESRNILKEAREMTAYIHEFYHMPGEKLVEKGEREGGLAGAALQAAGMSALVGAGVISGAASAWDIPGMAEFGRQVASGELLHEIMASPKTAIPSLIGQAIGAGITFGKGVKLIGKGAGRAVLATTRNVSAAMKTASAVEKGIEAAALGAFLYGVAEAKGASPVIIAGMAGIAKTKPKLKLKLETKTGKSVELTLGEAIKMIEEGKAEPVIEINGKKFHYVRLRGAKEGPALIPEDVLNAARKGNLQALEQLLGADVLFIREGTVPEIYVREKLTAESIAKMFEEAKKQLVEEMQQREKLLLEELQRTEAEIREVAEAIEKASGERRQLLQEQLKELQKKAARLRQELKKIAPEKLNELQKSKQKQVKADYTRVEGVAKLLEKAEEKVEAREQLLREHEKAVEKVGEFLEKAEEQRRRRTLLEEEQKKAESRVGEFLEWATKTEEKSEGARRLRQKTRAEPVKPEPSKVIAGEKVAPKPRPKERQLVAVDSTKPPRPSRLKLEHERPGDKQTPREEREEMKTLPIVEKAVPTPEPTKPETNIEIETTKKPVGSDVSVSPPPPPDMDNTDEGTTEQEKVKPTIIPIDGTNNIPDVNILHQIEKAIEQMTKTASAAATTALTVPLFLAVGRYGLVAANSRELARLLAARPIREVYVFA